MIYLKSLLAGFLAMFLAVPVLCLALVPLFHRAPSEDGVISWDLRSVLSSPQSSSFFGAGIMIAFGIGFYWEFRRVSARSGRS